MLCVPTALMPSECTPYPQIQKQLHFTVSLSPQCQCHVHSTRKIRNIQVYLLTVTLSKQSWFCPLQKTGTVYTATSMMQTKSSKLQVQYCPLHQSMSLSKLCNTNTDSHRYDCICVTSHSTTLRAIMFDWALKLNYLSQYLPHS